MNNDGLDWDTVKEWISEDYKKKFESVGHKPLIALVPHRMNKVKSILSDHGYSKREIKKIISERFCSPQEFVDYMRSKNMDAYSVIENYNRQGFFVK